MYLEQCGGGTDEGVDIEFQDDGRVILYGSQQCNGQGHRTTVTQILSDRLGYDADLITVHQGDSSRSPRGTTGGARMTSVHPVQQRCEGGCKHYQFGETACRRIA